MIPKKTILAVVVIIAVAGRVAAQIEVTQERTKKDSERHGLAKIVVAVADSYLQQHRSEFGLGLTVPLPAVEYSDLSLVAYEPQRYQGVEVLDSAIWIYIDLGKEEVRMHNGHPVVRGKRLRELELSVTPKLNAAAAVAAAIGVKVVDGGGLGSYEMAGTITGVYDRTPRLVILPPGEGLSTACLAWEIQAFSSGGGWAIYIDAQTGAAVKKIRGYDS